jgi:CRP/FNR family cyclic AMP-dependent transcriptional regulator
VDPSRVKLIPLFGDLPDDQLRAIATFANEVSVEEGKHLVDEGDYSYQFMAIEEGTAEVLRGDEPVAELGPGDYFGEIGLIERDRRTATVVAKTPMRLMTLDRWDLKRMEKDVPEAYHKIRQTMEERRQA